MIQCPRGTRDFLPDEMEKRRFYENKLRHTAQTFGFREIETPIFEDAELFILRSGPNVLKELYAFKDKGDRDIALRPEMTAPAIRMFVNGMSNDAFWGVICFAGIIVTAILASAAAGLRVRKLRPVALIAED